MFDNLFGTGMIVGDSKKNNKLGDTGSGLDNIKMVITDTIFAIYFS